MGSLLGMQEQLLDPDEPLLACTEADVGNRLDMAGNGPSTFSDNACFGTDEPFFPCGIAATNDQPPDHGAMHSTPSFRALLMCLLTR